MIFWYTKVWELTESLRKIKFQLSNAVYWCKPTRELRIILYSTSISSPTVQELSACTVVLTYLAEVEELITCSPTGQSVIFIIVKSRRGIDEIKVSVPWWTLKFRKYYKCDDQLRWKTACLSPRKRYCSLYTVFVENLVKFRCPPIR